MESSAIARLSVLIENLKNSKVRDLVNAQIKEFRENGQKSSRELFKELCFCILTANFIAEKSLKIQKEINDGFLTLPEHELTEKLRKLGHRFPQKRAKYIVEARKYADSLKGIIESINVRDKLREWLVKNIKGIGYKEASHFLRNIGYTDLAIIDFHIINILTKHGLIEKPRTLTKTKYLEIENLLREVAGKLNLSLAELDLYLWYMETGKVLK
ncbi:N-glycosylase [Candidatus Bathyarchaeota archaeon]|nr:MAG: N-glycosylase [Candidatus Bathyarchaeota archaeon]